MKHIPALLLCLAVLIALSACGKDTGEGRTLSFPLDTAPVHLDPAVAESADELLVINNCFEGLLRQNAAGELIPGVAERWEISADGLTYTFHLRQNTHWRLHANVNDVLGGKDVTVTFDTQVTAADFVFGLRRALNPATKSPGAAALSVIQDVQASDAFTLQITLAQPSGTFLYALTQSAAMPCNEAYFNACGGRYGLAAKYLLCNGPFYLSLMETSALRLRKNDGYAGEFPVSPAGVLLKTEPDSAARLRLLGAEGGFDAAIVPAELVPEDVLAAHESLLLQNATLALLFQCQRPALKDVNVRAALCAAIDPAALGLLLPGLLPASVRVGGARLDSLAEAQPGILYQPERARQLLERASAGKTALNLICAPAHEQIFRRVLQQWQSLFGLRLDITLEPLEPEDMAKRLRSGDFDVALASLRASSSFALQSLQELSGDSAPMRYQSKTLTALLRAAAQTENPAETARACRQAEAHLLQNGAAYPLAAQPSRLLLAEGVAGLEISPAGDHIFFGNGTKLD